MSKINNWDIKHDITYFVEEDITSECGYSDGDGRGDGRGDGIGFDDGDGIGDGSGDGRANIHGYGRGGNKL